MTIIEKKLKKLCEKFNSSKTVYKDELSELQVWAELMLARKELERFQRSKELYDLNVSKNDDHDN
tara:strand:+ start:351 stop:545 length:195 start_codon:yes stop_codon:yes gene_type:complete